MKPAKDLTNRQLANHLMSVLNAKTSVQKIMRGTGNRFDELVAELDRRFNDGRLRNELENDPDWFGMALHVCYGGKK